MKARTKYEREVVAASKRLPPISAAQVEWAKRHLFRHEGYWCGSEVWCSDCGGVFHKSRSSRLVDVLDDKAVCPHCGQRLKIQRSRRLKEREEIYLTVVTTIVGLQVIRTWNVLRQGRKGVSVNYSFNEVTQHWLNNRGCHAIIACNRVPFSYYTDRFIFGTMSLKHSRSGHYATMAYDFQGTLYPRRRVLPIIARNGYRPVANALEYDVMLHILTDPCAETLIKAGQDSMLELMCNRGWTAKAEWHAVKIAIRNNYTVRDASIWLDHIRNLQELGMDTHNARYVCPADLYKEHDKVLARLERRRKELKEAARRKQAAEAEAEYLAAKKRFFGLLIVGNGISIRPLQSVAEFLAEGEAMHHCVFENRYYKNPEALIMTARNERDERLETIELNLDTFKVVQSRGVCNRPTPRHNEIVSLVKDNIGEIRKLAKAI